MDYLHRILSAAEEPECFVRATFSVPRGRAGPWRKVSIQPGRAGEDVVFRAVFHGPRKEHHRTIAPSAMEEELRALADMGFRNIHLQTLEGDLHVRVTKKGKVLAKEGRPSTDVPPPAGEHDRAKPRPLGGGAADPFLEAVGICRDGRVVPGMRDKFRQINRFLELLGHALAAGEEDGPLHVVDCGCGRALLTLAAAHYLRDVLGRAVRVTGVDTDADVLAAARLLQERVGESAARFVQRTIADVAMEDPPDIVLSLHACDTATDEALARGVAWEARLILAAPCCQHELHRQLKRDDHRAALRHGILRERLADILTDALRAAALRVMSYRADVIEFVTPEATAKNLLLRAERTASGRALPGAAEEYARLCAHWGVEPVIGRMLGAGFAKRISG